MKYIDENKINDLLQNAKKASTEEIDAILNKSKSLQRLTLAETAALLSAEEPKIVNKIFETAAFVKDKIYGKRIVLFAPLYISNICGNSCVYCAFRVENKDIERKALSVNEIKEEISWMLKRGHKRILMVAGESAPAGQKPIDYYVDSVKTIYEVQVGQHKIKRVNINCAPLEIDEFKRLKASGIGTFQIFQETYNDKQYRLLHPRGPKSDPDNRLDAVDRAFKAGIDDVGIGTLYGLYDYRFDTLAMLMHVEHLEKTFNVGPHTISVPRIEPALGTDFDQTTPYNVSDDNFKKVVAALRLSVPYTGIIMSTRETAEMRDQLINLGVSQVSAESKTTPGGYTEGKDNAGQFALSDQRSLDEVVDSLINHGFIPSFCAACYRKERTGEAFMNLAKPGNIKEMCQINALLTMKEYLEDFASDKVKSEGNDMVKDLRNKLTDKDKTVLDKLFACVDKGERDKYV